MNHRALIYFISLIFTSCSYLPEDGVSSSNLVSDKSDYAVYYSGEIQPVKAFFMIPGGLVDPYVYECWINQLTDLDTTIAVVLLKYPSNLAITNPEKVIKVAEELPGFKNRVIGGHSLGGVVAAMVVEKNRDLFDGLILLASYSGSTSDLSDWEGTVLSIYGSEDQLSTPEDIESNKKYLPLPNEVNDPGEITGQSGFTNYYKIDGANHSGFGCYGKQNGDGEAQIPVSVQQEQVISGISSFFHELW